MTDGSKEVALAAKIVGKASDTLSSLDREMKIMKWPNEFRVIMWEAVAAEAQARAASLVPQHRPSSPESPDNCPQNTTQEKT